MATGPSRIQQFNQVNARAWLDDAFRRKLVSDPEGTLKEQGVEVPAGVKVVVVEDDERKVYWVIPKRPPTGVMRNPDECMTC
jgi:hypothetical protein